MDRSYRQVSPWCDLRIHIEGFEVKILAGVTHNGSGECVAGLNNLIKTVYFEGNPVVQ